MKIQKKTQYFLLSVLSAVVILLIVSLPGLLKRLQFESNNTAYEICLEYDEIKQISISERISIDAALAVFKQVGITSVAVFQTGISDMRNPLRNYSRNSFSPDLAFDENIFEHIKQKDLRILMRPINPVYADGQSFARRIESRDFPEAADMFLSYGDEAYGYPDKLKRTAEMLKQKNIRPLWLEFGGQKGGKSIARQCLSAAIRSHSVDTTEMARIPNRRKLSARFIRAVRNRGVRFLYIHLLPEKGLQGNTEFLQSIIKALKKAGFTPGIPVMRNIAQNAALPARQIGAVGIALLFPVMGILLGVFMVTSLSHYSQSKWIGCVIFLLINIIMFCGGLIIASVLSAHQYMTGLYIFRGVKFAYLFPLALLTGILFYSPNWKNLIKRQICWRDVLFLLAGCGFVAVLILRSGNNSLLYFPGGMEETMRHMLEYYLCARPRTKEFLFAQPALLLSLWQFGKYKSGRMLDKPVMAKILLIVGAVGQISIINTFLHAHAPLRMSVLRTLHGIWLGTLIGIMLLLIYRSVCWAVSKIR